MVWVGMSEETARVVEFERDLVECFSHYIDLKNQSIIDRAFLRNAVSKMVEIGYRKINGDEIVIGKDKYESMVAKDFIKDSFWDIEDKWNV